METARDRPLEEKTAVSYQQNAAATLRSHLSSRCGIAAGMLDFLLFIV